jgi:hypothetical protein
MSITRRVFAVLLVVLLLLGGCGRPEPASTATPTVPPPVAGLSADEVATLSSLAQVDDYPLYVMHYQGAYGSWRSARVDEAPAWACSLFAALGDPNNRLYGRNFDWDLSPALLLFADPPDGYASVSLVDISFLGFAGDRARGLADRPLAEREGLLNAPFLPFDGLNAHGLSIGMAAVPSGDVPLDPAKETLGSLGIIREMLDHAGDVDEALAILQSYNIDMAGGPPIHYLLADRSGRSLLVEFYEGEMVVTPNEAAWQQATNFLRAAAGDDPQGQCWRYDKISERLTASAGWLTAPEAMKLLADVAQLSTQWSAVYGLSSGDVQIALGRQYEQVHTFHLELAAEP